MVERGDKKLPGSGRGLRLHSGEVMRPAFLEERGMGGSAGISSAKRE